MDVKRFQIWRLMPFFKEKCVEKSLFFFNFKKDGGFEYKKHRIVVFYNGDMFFVTPSVHCYDMKLFNFQLDVNMFYNQIVNIYYEK